MNMSNISVWERLENGFQELSVKTYHDITDTAKLMIAIILSGGKERDNEYFEGDLFLRHCYLAGLNSDYVRLSVEKAWYYIDNKLPLQDFTIEEEIEEEGLDY